MNVTSKKAWVKPELSKLGVEMTEARIFACGKDAYYEGMVQNCGPITQAIVGALTGGDKVGS